MYQSKSIEDNKIGLLDLPVEILHNIFSILPYCEISHLREVCRRFDTICQELLNQGFKKAQRLIPESNKEIKSKLPKRESHRQNHPLKLHAEVLSALDTRISLLDMTYTKCIEMSICCFIPGLVLDEIYHVVRLLKTSSTIDRSHKVLKELRDLSSMAMEHFDEVILPSIRRQFFDINNRNHRSNISTCSDTFKLFKNTAGLFFGKRDGSIIDCYSVPESTSKSTINTDVNNFETNSNTILKMIDGVLKHQKQLAVNNFELQSMVRNQNTRIQHLESLLNVNSSSELISSQASTTDASSNEMRSTQSSSLSGYDSPASSQPDLLRKSDIDQDSEIPTKIRKLT